MATLSARLPHENVRHDLGYGHEQLIYVMCDLMGCEMTHSPYCAQVRAMGWLATSPVTSVPLAVMHF
jgi:hypothetical protein